MKSPDKEKEKPDPVKCEISRVHDLNIFVLFITKFYSFVFEKLKRAHPRSRLGSWVESFILSAELEAKGDNSLKNAIAKIMLDEADVTIEDWKQLQAIRRLRNSISHPSATATAAATALNERWETHRSYSALKKMLNVSSRITSAAATPPRTPIRDIPVANWRSTMRGRDKMDDQDDEMSN